MTGVAQSRLALPPAFTAVANMSSPAIQVSLSLMTD
jgi:hypothetical protein